MNTFPPPPAEIWKRLPRAPGLFTDGSYVAVDYRLLSVVDEGEDEEDEAEIYAVACAQMEEWDGVTPYTFAAGRRLARLSRFYPEVARWMI